MASDLLDGVRKRMVGMVCCGSGVVSCSGDDEWHAAFCRSVMLSW
jgi:hypothetical protein